MSFGLGCVKDFNAFNTITITSPGEGERWVANEIHDITWKTTGNIFEVAIFYSIDNFTNDIQTVITSTPNTGRFSWKIPDDRYPNVKLRIADARDPNCYIQSADSFKIDYYTITFEMFDDVTGKRLDRLNVLCSSGWADYMTIFPVVKDYPYGRYTTIFHEAYYLPTPYEWLTDKDKVITLTLESAIYHAPLVHANFKYDNINDILQVTAYLVRDGLIFESPDTISIDIYDQSEVLIKILTSSKADENGIFCLQWNNTGLPNNTIYRAKTAIIVFGHTFQHLILQEIRIPVKRKS
jgi:hypothetical protein